MEVPFERKICPPQELAARLGSRARPLVFTNGVFDILHRGHVTYLAEASVLVATLESVHLVTWFDEDTPLALILASRPEVLAKGGDWKPEAMIGAAEVRGWGGSVHSIPFRHQRSTTALLKKIRES